MKIRNLLLLATVLVPAAFCDLTVDQKVADFSQLAALFAKNYALYQWKRDFVGFDLYDVKPWIERVKASKDDIDFYDICTRYVASLQDSHDEFFLTSDFVANLPITLDLYDGKVLIDWINPTRLPETSFPINVGDELVSLDGKSVDELIEAYIPYSADGSGSVSARRRLAVETIWWRRQKFFPRAHEIGDTASIVVRDQSGGLATYVVPWLKSGTPVLHAAPITSPGVSSAPAQTFVFPRHTRRAKLHEQATGADGNSGSVWSGDPLPAQNDIIPPYLPALRSLQISGTIGTTGYAKYGDLVPAFTLPPAFQARLGTRPTDPFVSGTFPVGQHRVGFIRIPTLEPADQTAAWQAFANEILFFKANTDALVIDIMGNGGGDVCYTETLASMLMPKPFRSVISRLRGTQDLAWTFSEELSYLKQTQQQSLVNLYTDYLAQVQAALNLDGGMTGPLPVCPGDTELVQPALARDGSLFAYTKPILVLVDDLTISSAELFAMFMQDEGRGTIFGVRTGGGGGSPGNFWAAGVYSEGNVRITRSMFTRKRPVSTPGYPTVDHFENVGIYPDILVDYMTRDNLMTGGTAFVEAFSQAVEQLIVAQQ